MNKLFIFILAGAVALGGIVYLGFTAASLNNQNGELRSEVHQQGEKIVSLQKSLEGARNAQKGTQARLEACVAQNEEAMEVADSFYDVLNYVLGITYTAPDTDEFGNSVKEYQKLEACAK